MFKVPEKFRMTSYGPLYSDKSYGNNGLFMIKSELDPFVTLAAIAADGDGWEHVSVSTENRIPTWEEMNQIKDLFWGEEDCVIQFHPPKSKYINKHPYVLHLWRRIGENLETPPKYMI